MKHIVIISIFTFLFSFALIAQENDIIWDYPVKPGMEEWKALSSHDEMIEVCQIPADELKTMTTKDLIIVCLNYPLQFDFYAYNNLLEGVRNVAANFNGLKELFARKDNAQCLLEMLKLKNAEVTSIIENKDATILQRGELIVKQTLTEMLLSHEAVVANTTDYQQKEIASVAMNNIAFKEQMPQLYSTYSVEASAYLLCVNLKTITGNLSPASDMFRNTGWLKQGVLNELKQSYINLSKE